MKKQLLSAFIALSCGFTLTAQTYIAAYSSAPNVWGYLKTDGTKITEALYKSVSPFSSDGYATAVNIKTKEAVLINSSGESIPLSVQGILDLTYVGENQKPALKSAIFKLGTKYGIVSITGQVTHPAEYDKIYPTDYAFAVGRVGTQHSILNFDGTDISLDADIDDVRDFRNGSAPYRQKSTQLMGFIDLKGTVIIPAAHQSVGYFQSGLAWAKTPDSKVGFIDEKGKWVIQPIYDMAKEFDPLTKLALVKRGDVFLYVKTDGTEVLVSGAEDRLGEFSEGLAYAKKGGKFGFVDPNGKWVIEAKYDKVEPFKDGFARVKLGALWGFIDKSGKEILAPTYTRLEDFHDGLAAFADGKLWGYVNQQGQVAIAPQFEDYDHFKNGFAVVKQKKMYGIIQTNGTFAVEPSFLKIRPVSKVAK